MAGEQGGQFVQRRGGLELTSGLEVALVALANASGKHGITTQ